VPRLESFDEAGGTGPDDLLKGVGCPYRREVALYAVIVWKSEASGFLIKTPREIAVDP
jgi:hypothetical protein